MSKLEQDHILKRRKGQTAPTPLLAFLCGSHAEAIAQLWPAPHEGFFALPTARRHAAAILAGPLGKRHALTADGLVRLLERQKDRLIGELLVGPNHARGFLKALSKLGEPLWSEADYEALMRLFCEADANLYLRHLDDIRPIMLETLSILPAALRKSRLLHFVRSKAAARDIRTAYDAVARIRSAEAQKKATDRWHRAVKAERLFEMIREDLDADHPIRWTPPPVLPDVFQRLDTLKSLKATALTFKNCLADFTDQFSTGQLAVYVCYGTPPAVFALRWNTDGWRLAEAEAADNQALPEPVLQQIVDQLEAKGVRIGSSLCNLKHRLTNYGHSVDQVPEHENQDQTLHERCDLGDLWN